MRTRINILIGLIGLLCIAARPVKLLAQTCGHPHIQMSINKHVDENGNVISYDTTFTYVFSGQDFNQAYMDSIFKKLGSEMNATFFSIPFSDQDMANYPFLQQFGKMDMDKIHQMMEKQMNEFMQNYDPSNGFFCQPPPMKPCCPDTCCPAKKNSYHCNPPQKNKSKGGVQI
ncbi:MAG TPA: hypothetical protein VK806_07255 [Bacteroidia bacterium]|jgi:hypothetical protein|nr:hypothetical protein [Bacteroidia bacterium]